MNYLEQMKETWAQSGLDADWMMESMITQWKAMGMNPDLMLQHLSNTPAVALDTVNSLQHAFEDIEQETDLFQIENPFSAWDDDQLMFNKQEGTSIEIMKAISCGALLTVINQSHLNTISTGLSKEDAQSILSCHWDINNRSDLIDTIDWLATSGHRRTCDAIWQQLSKHPHTQWPNLSESILESLNIDADDIETAQEQIANIIEIYPDILEYITISDKSSINILAWDACRAINLYRWGYDAQLVSIEEATQNILKISEALFQQYSSWEHLSISYIIGTAMWSGDLGMVNDVLHAHYLLTTNSQSPWLLIDWI